MPYIDTKTNVSVSKAQEISIKEKLGKAISLFPGKSETYLMLAIEDDCHMYLSGSDAPLAYLEVKIFGRASAADYDRVTAGLTEIISAELQIPPTRVYIKYEEIEHWGWNGSNF